MSWRETLGLLLVALTASACLSHQYEISGDELGRLARTRPEERGQRVRVVQQTGFDEDDVDTPPDYGPDEYSPGSPNYGHWHVNYSSPGPWASGPHLGGGRAGSRAPASPNVGGRTPASPRLGGNPTGPATGRTPATPDLGRAPAAPGGARTPASPTVGSAAGKSSRRVPSSSQGGKSGGGGVDKLPLSGGGGGGGDAEAAVVLAVVAVAAAGGILAVHAGTEGGRYDGWVSLPPEQAVLVERHNGTRYWVPLTDLSLEDSRSAERALVVDDGGGLERLERARLKRSGLVYSLEAGVAQTSARGGVGPLGAQSRLGLGTFFMQELGVMVGGQFSAADRGGTVFNGRLFTELQLLPFAYRKFHFGFYGEAGYAWALHDAPGRTHRGKGFAPGAGALLQYDLTTRLAASLRGGLVRMPGVAAGGEVTEPGWLPELGLGLAVY